MVSVTVLKVDEPPQCFLRVLYSSNEAHLALFYLKRVLDKWQWVCSICTASGAYKVRSPTAMVLLVWYYTFKNVLYEHISTLFLLDLVIK